MVTANGECSSTLASILAVPDICKIVTSWWRQLVQIMNRIRTVHLLALPYASSVRVRNHRYSMDSGLHELTEPKSYEAAMTLPCAV